jgi:LPS-assembly protein
VLVYARELDAAESEQGQALGEVELFRGDQHLATEKLLYHPQQRYITLPMPFDYRDQQVWINAQEGHYDFASESGTFSGIDYGLTGSSANGSAGQVSLYEGNRSVLQDIDYTTCPGDSPDWELSARELEFLHDDGIGYARGATLRFKNVPILWAPWFTFPIDDRRKTGFLYPSLGQNSDTGFEIGVPWYWNIAPNQDLTLEPRYFTRRGFMLSAEYRFMTQRTGGSAEFDYLPDDKETGEARWHYLVNHVSRPWRRWSTEVVIDRVSDNRFFQDFGTSLIATSRQFLRSNASLNGVGRFWTFEFMADDFQVIDDSIAPQNEPYRRLPRIGFWLDRPLPIPGVYLALDSELVYFDRDIGATGARLDLMPRIYWDGTYRWGFIRPSLAYRYTGYDLDRHGEPGDESPQRGTQIVSLDTGLMFERQTASGGMQTLQPRLFYLYVPFEEQNDLPLFDTGEYTFGFSQLFNTNRFSGADRQADSHQVSLAVSTHYYDDNGQQIWSLGLGQIFYLDPLRVTLDDDEPVDRDLSPFIAEFRWRLGKRYEALAGVQWDWDLDQTELANLGVRYTGDNGQQLRFEYRFRRDRVDQFDLRATWPVNERWRVLGQVNYSFRDDDLLEFQGGFEYESCCWALRTVYRRYLKNRDGDFRDAIYLELNLKGLAAVGTSGRGLF